MSCTPMAKRKPATNSMVDGGLRCLKDGKMDKDKLAHNLLDYLIKEWGAESVSPDEIVTIRDFLDETDVEGKDLFLLAAEYELKYG